MHHRLRWRSRIVSRDRGPLPKLVETHGERCHTRAQVVEIGGRQMMRLPYAAPIGPSRGKRYRVAVDGGRFSVRMVMNVAGQAVVRLLPNEALGKTQVHVVIETL